MAERAVEHASENAVLSWEQAAYPRALDYDHANIFRRVLAVWASPFLVRGKKVRLPHRSIHALAAFLVCIQDFISRTEFEFIEFRTCVHPGAS